MGSHLLNPLWPDLFPESLSHLQSKNRLDLHRSGKKVHKLQCFVLPSPFLGSWQRFPGPRLHRVLHFLFTSAPRKSLWLNPWHKHLYIACYPHSMFWRLNYILYAIATYIYMSRIIWFVSLVIRTNRTVCMTEVMSFFFRASKPVTSMKIDAYLGPET